MEPLKKRTIIWEENNEPPKNYIWVKSDGKAYEYNNSTRSWELSNLVGGGEDNTATHAYSVTSLDQIENPKEGDIAVIEPEVLESIASGYTFSPPATKIVVNKKKDFPAEMSFSGYFMGGPAMFSLFGIATEYPIVFDGSAVPYTGFSWTATPSGFPDGETIDDYLEVVVGDEIAYEYYGEEWKERVDSETIKESSQSYAKNNGGANAVSIVSSPKEGDIEDFADKIGTEIATPNTTSVYSLLGATMAQITSIAITCTNATPVTGTSKAKLCFSNSLAIVSTTPKYTIESDSVYYGLKVTDEDTGDTYYVVSPQYAQIYGTALPSNYVTKLVLPIPYTEVNMGNFVQKSYRYYMAIQEDTSEGSTYSILNSFAITSLLPGVAKEYYNGKWETRSKPLTQQDLTPQIEDKQTVFTVPTAQIANPKEGDVVVYAGEKQTLSSSPNSTMLAISNSDYASYAIHIVIPTGEATSHITIQYVDAQGSDNIYLSPTETQERTIEGGKIHKIITNGIVIADLTVEAIISEGYIKEYYNGEWTDRKATEKQSIYNLPTDQIVSPKEGDIAIIPDSWGELTIEPTGIEDNGTITKIYNVESYSTNSRIKVTSDPTCFASSYIDSENNSHNSGSVSTNVFPVGTKSITLWETGEFPEVHFYEEVTGATKEYVNGEWTERVNVDEKLEEFSNSVQTTYTAAEWPIAHPKEGDIAVIPSGTSFSTVGYIDGDRKVWDIFPSASVLDCTGTLLSSKKIKVVREDFTEIDIYLYSNGMSNINHYNDKKVIQIYADDTELEMVAVWTINSDIKIEYINGKWKERNLNDAVENLAKNAANHQTIVSRSAFSQYDLGIVYDYPNGTLVSFYTDLRKLTETPTYYNYSSDLFVRGYLDEEHGNNSNNLTDPSVYSTLVYRINDTDKMFINVVRKEIYSPCGGGTYTGNAIEVTYASTQGVYGDPTVPSEADYLDPMTNSLKVPKQYHNMDDYGNHSVIEVLPENVANPILLSECITVWLGKESDGKFYEVFNKQLVERDPFERKVSSLTLKTSLDRLESSYWQIFSDISEGYYYGIKLSDDNTFYSITSCTWDPNTGTGELKFGPYTATLNQWTYSLTTT